MTPTDYIDFFEGAVIGIITVGFSLSLLLIFREAGK